MVAMAKETLVYMFPGQGAQEAKMFKDIYDKYDEAKKIWAVASDIFGEDLVDICMKQPFKEMKGTDRAQILINTCSITMYELSKKRGILPDIVMGHSAGELAALYASGAVDLEDVFFLISCRGKYMYEAAMNHKGKMIAITGIDTSDIHRTINEFQTSGVIALGNHNSNSQFVITGDFETVTLYEQEIRKIPNSRVVDLKQQGAWHSCHMAEAQERFGAELAKIRFKKPDIPIMLNFSAEIVDDIEDIRSQLTSIITSTVNWYPLLYKLMDSPQPLFVEMGPNKILRGLLRRSYQHLGFSDYCVMNVNDCFSFDQFVRETEERNIKKRVGGFMNFPDSVSGRVTA